MGEAIAVDLFGLQLEPAAGATGIDGRTKDGRTVQVKTTTSGGGPAFRPAGEATAEHLLFFDLDTTSATGTVVFNGPQRMALSLLPDGFTGQRALTPQQIRAADARVRDEDRLPLLGTGRSVMLG